MRDTVVAFDTSGPACELAIAVGGHAHEVVEPMAHGQGERLFPLLGELLRQSGRDWASVKRIGVGTGPGNFTGIRIAVAAARGLALSLGIPAIGIGRLEALALNQPRPVVTVLSGPRGSLHFQVFDRAIVHPPRHAIDPASVARSLPDGCTLVGPAAEAVAAIIDAPLNGPAMTPIKAILALAQDRQAPEARPAPLYLRPPDAKPVPTTMPGA